MELKQKGANALIGSFKQLQVSLIWTAPVDLDLMAFYKTKDGRTGGIYSSNYAGGSMGSLNQFPYIELSGDAGLGGSAGDNREELRIARIDHFEELYIVALNFTDASSGENNVFADYDANVSVITDTGEAHSVALDSAQYGSVAILCKFKKDFMGASLVNASEVLSFKEFQAKVPGASEIKLSSKVILKQKGDRISLKSNDFHAQMRWKTAVDLDLHCFFRMKPDAPPPPKGLIKKLLDKKQASRDGHVFFFKQGEKDKWPWIYLDQDAGVGDKAGNNVENIYFTNLTYLEQAIIAANIFNKPASNFASYDGVVIVEGGGQVIEIPLTEEKPGSWCIIAKLDNFTGTPKLININKTQENEPSIDEFI